VLIVVPELPVPLLEVPPKLRVGRASVALRLLPAAVVAAELPLVELLGVALLVPTPAAASSWAKGLSCAKSVFSEANDPADSPPEYSGSVLEAPFSIDDIR